MSKPGSEVHAQSLGQRESKTRAVPPELVESLLNPAQHMRIDYARMDFPYLLHKFISATERTHPNVARWSPCGKYFFVNRHNQEFEKLIEPHFKHGRYESLRRQLNAYGFRKVSAEKSWSRQDDIFHRDRPQDLVNVRPRRRESKPRLSRSQKAIKAKLLAKSSKPTPATSFPGRKNVGSQSSSCQKKSSVSIERMSSSSYGRPKSPIPSEESITQASECIHARGVEASEEEYIGKESSKGSLLEFPEMLHRFIEDCSATHPDVAVWNSTHTAFNVEMHHPLLRGLLLRYFRHGNYSSLRRQLNLYGFQRNSDGFYRKENFRRGNYCNVEKTKKEFDVKRKSQSPKQKHPSRKSSVFEGDSQEPTPAQIAATGADQSSESSGSMSDSDASSLFDHDLSTYATLKTDEMSFERLDSHDFDEKSFEHLNERDDLVVQGDSGREGTVVVDVTDEVPTTPPKFQILQKVYARDKDGVMYTAVIRRQLYGPQYHRQVEMGLVTSKEEAEKLLDDDDYEPTWHYFVHYNKWNVSFDRWVPENNVYEITDTVIAYAERISKEHRALQLEMRKPGIKGKKINGAAFLCEWKKRMLRLTKEMKFEQIGDIKTADNVDFATRLEEMDAGPDVSPTKPVKQNTWTKAALVTELKLREQGLTGKRPLSQANAVVLPFALKKIIVQQWEIISQCHMMPCLPAPTTVRQALNKYLESKNVAVHPASSTLEQQGTGIDTNISDGKTDPLKEVDELDRAKVTGAKAAGEGNEEPVDADSREQEWRDMADGIAQLFDEALASRLLYLEELPQLSVIDDLPEYSMTPFSGIYGCEHLLRLFVRLPEMLADRLSDAEARPIIARVNDFVRFLHKNHGTLLTQTHRKLNELELKEQQKMMKLEEKKIKSQVVIAATEGPIGKKPRPHKN